jgi:hypothetical protein
VSDRYIYSDNKKVHVAEGEHGLNVRIAQDDTTYLQSLPDDGASHASFEVRNYDPVEAEPLVCRQHMGSTAHATVDQMAVVEFISFGHSHFYPAEQYPDMAPLWRERLLAEARTLARALQGDQAIAYEFLEGDGSAGAWMSHIIAATVDKIQRRSPLKPEEYDPLMKRVWDTSDKIKAGSAADYQLLHDAGLEFMHIRHEQELLRKRFLGRMDELVDAAKKGETAAEQTEDASFWLLDIYGQVVCKDQASLFAYRFGVMLVRAGARGWGSLLSDNSARAAFQQVAGVMRRDLPKAATALMLSFVKKAFPKMGALETFAEQLIAIQIHVVFICLDFVIFELDNLPSEKRAHVDQALLEKLAPELAQDIVSAIATIVVAGKTADLPANPTVRKQVESIGAVVPAVINSSIVEVNRMKQIAEAEHRPFSDVFASEGGWAVVRICRDGGKAFLESVVKGKMAAVHQDDVKYYTTLILSIKLYVTPVDGSKVKGPPDRPVYVQKAGEAEDDKLEEKAIPETRWDTKMNPTKKGHDANGDIGLDKHQRVSGKASSDYKTKPPKPSRAERKGVKTTPRPNRVPTAKEMVDHVGPAYTWEEIEKMTEAGTIRADAHVLGVVVRNPVGKTIREWYEISELDAALGTAKYLGHTEQKALARISLMKLDPGSKIIFVGHLQPCNRHQGCNEGMKEFVERNRLENRYEIEYRAAYSDDGTTKIYYDPDEGRTSDSKKALAARKKTLH